MDPIKAAAEELQKKRRRNKMVRAANMAIYAAAAALFFPRSLRPVGLALMAAGLLFHFLVTRRLAEAYREEAGRANLRFGLCAGLTGFTYTAKGGMSYRDFCAWDLAPILPGERSLLCRGAFTARDGPRFVTGQEATFHYQLPREAGKGVRFLSGSLFTAGSPEGGGWLFARPDVLNGAALAQFLQERQWESVPEALEGWAVYRQADAPELPEGVLRRVGNLKKTVSILRITGRGAAAFLNGRFYTGAKYPAIQPTEQLLRQNILPEWDSLLALFRQLL